MPRFIFSVTNNQGLKTESIQQAEDMADALDIMNTAMKISDEEVPPDASDYRIIELKISELGVIDELLR